MSEEGKFIIFCIESYKQHYNLSGAAVLDLFDRYGVFDYIREFFDILHTTGNNYINNDIDLYLRSRGAQIPQGNGRGLTIPIVRGAEGKYNGIKQEGAKRKS